MNNELSVVRVLLIQIVIGTSLAIITLSCADGIPVMFHMRLLKSHPEQRVINTVATIK